ncbi:MAG: hypothetical protein VYE46_06185, partial [Cyanobacteriota bacterium]|nr:hypothetical protein [Cyanobacteriota bacterium]
AQLARYGVAVATTISRSSALQLLHDHNSALMESMSNSVAERLGTLQPIVPPRLERIRQQISIQELELSLTRLGFAPTTSNEPSKGIAS